MAPDATTAQWLTWRESEPLQDLLFQELDLQDAETWPPLLELLGWQVCISRDGWELLANAAPKSF